MLEVNRKATNAATDEVRARLVRLIKAWSQPKEHYAGLLSRARTPQASELIFRIYAEIVELERGAQKRVRNRRAKSSVRFVEAIERFVGDLLRSKIGTNGPALIYRPVGKSRFKDDPVKYDMFTKSLDGLKALGLVGHRQGQQRFRRTAFGPDVVSVSLAGRAARFWATGKLLKLAEHYGIDTNNVGNHFASEPPANPLVLKDYGVGRGRARESGRSVDYPRTPKTERLKNDIRELNEFLAGFKITGGKHSGYIRVFNNLSWRKGGRLSSVGEGSYQQLSEPERLKMRINGECVAEIDIQASQLTIYHAMVGAPLGTGDPYARVGLDRAIAKLWTLASFGNSKPAERWPPDMAEDYKRETGKDLAKQAKAKDVARKMMDAFPALKNLEEHSDVWGDLQFSEAEAIISTMLILMREERVPSLSMHDGLIVPRSLADLARAVLAQEFKRVVGVEPTLTVDTEEGELVSDL